MGAAAFDAQGIGERVDSGAYPEGGVVPGSGGTAVDACFRCRRVPRDRAGCGSKTAAGFSLVALGVSWQIWFSWVDDEAPATQCGQRTRGA